MTPARRRRHWPLVLHKKKCKSTHHQRQGQVHHKVSLHQGSRQGGLVFWPGGRSARHPSCRAGTHSRGQVGTDTQPGWPTRPAHRTKLTPTASVTISTKARPAWRARQQSWRDIYHRCACGNQHMAACGGTLPSHPSISLRNAKNSRDKNCSAGKAGRAGKAGAARTCECECQPALAREGAEGDLQCAGRFRGQHAYAGRQGGRQGAQPALRAGRASCEQLPHHALRSSVGFSGAV